jgi:phenylpyruvate tautomerase PptA (4-oxalocrotonate tautomerase family)
MPLYEVSHFTPLSAHQQERLAQHITYAHSRQFHTPSMFVNVVYKDISQAGFFVGGKKVRACLDES